MKIRILALLFGILLLASPAMAAHNTDDELWRFDVTTVRYRFDWEIASDFGTDESVEYFDDDFDLYWDFNKGDLEIFFEMEVADSNLGDDIAANTDWESVLGGYGAIWRPEALADSEFKLQAGDFGTSFGKVINNDDSPHGSIGVAWKTGDMSFVLEYGRRAEGAINDDVEGDEHLIRGQVHTPLGESGFNMGAYAAFYTGTDLTFVVATDENPGLRGGRDLFIGAVEFAGAVSNMDLYTEASFATGSSEETGTEVDLSGFYIMGGTKMNVGQITLGIEGGFATGDEDGWADGEDEGFTAINSDFWLGQILHDEGLIVRTSGKDGGLSNIMYGQVTADLSPTEKLALNAGLIYLKPVEDIVSRFTNLEADTYGFEFFGNAKYKLSDQVSYTFYWGYAIPDEDFIEDNQYQFTSRLEFKF